MIVYALVPSGEQPLVILSDASKVSDWLPDDAEPVAALLGGVRVKSGRGEIVGVWRSDTLGTLLTLFGYAVK